MKRCFMILAGVCTLFTAALAQQSDRDRLIQSEILRYKAALKQEAASVTAEDRIDVKYYKLDLWITTSPQYLTGNVLMNAVSKQDGLSSITLDLMNSMTVDSVKVGGSSSTFSQGSASFSVTLDRSYNTGEVMTVMVYYRGRPGSSGFGSFEFSTHQSIPWVWSLSEPYGAKDWWPCKDHPMDKADSVDIYVRCDSSFRVGSNGKLLSVVTNGDGTKTHHWHHHYPISTYLVSVAITNFAQFTNWFKYSPTDSTPVLNYVLPEDLASAQANLPYVVTELQTYSNLFGLYPFADEKYGHSEFGWGGGMEHQTMTSVGGFGEWLTAHELAHQWFGDMITCRTWPDIWLNEGFATYCEVLYMGQKYGTGQYWAEMNGNMNSAKSAVGSIYVQDTSNVGSLFDGSLVYDKGAVVLHMLRHVLGDSLFFASMKAYAGNPSLRFNTASTGDFRSVCESVSGKNLAYFFNEWIFGQKYPKYSIGWSATPAGPSSYTVTAAISQTTGTSTPVFFTMPMDLKVVSGGWDTTVTVFNDSVQQTFTFTVSHNPSSVQLDPDGWILKDIVTQPTFSTSRPYIIFGYIKIGVTKTDSIDVINPGISLLTVTNAATDNPEYGVTPTSGSIPPSGHQRFYVTFTPDSMGPRSGNLIFTHSGPTSPNYVPLSGQGVPPSVSGAVARLWNLVSVPVNAIDQRTTILFPTAASVAYTYDSDSGYIRKDTLRTGMGYWLKFSSDQTVSLAGYLTDSESVSVAAGWNLIGSVSDSVPVAGIVSYPPGIIASEIFGYGHGYVVAPVIVPASGYWVKTSGPGILTIAAPPSPPPRGAQGTQAAARVAGFTVLKLRDASGSEQSLSFGSRPAGEFSLSRYQMPPVPPEGVFDARFASGRILELIEEGQKQRFAIQVSSAAYPLTISWESSFAGNGVVLSYGEGRRAHLSGAGYVRVDAPGTGLAVEVLPGEEMPRVYTLEQNYPNPFNPATVIRYALPAESNVSVRIFNLLGQEVKRLVEGVQAAGYRTVEWDATDNAGLPAPGGVYFCRMNATGKEHSSDSFTGTKKLLLLR
jgi:aminopeptidase N